MKRREKWRTPTYETRWASSAICPLLDLSPSSSLTLTQPPFHQEFLKLIRALTPWVHTATPGGTGSWEDPRPSISVSLMWLLCHRTPMCSFLRALITRYRQDQASQHLPRPRGLWTAWTSKPSLAERFLSPRLSILCWSTGHCILQIWSKAVDVINRRISKLHSLNLIA